MSQLTCVWRPSGHEHISHPPSLAATNLVVVAKTWLASTDADYYWFWGLGTLWLQEVHCPQESYNPTIQPDTCPVCKPDCTTHKVPVQPLTATCPQDSGACDAHKETLATVRASMLRPQDDLDILEESCLCLVNACLQKLQPSGQSMLVLSMACRPHDNPCLRMQPPMSHGNAVNDCTVVV